MIRAYLFIVSLFFANASFSITYAERFADQSWRTNTDCPAKWEPFDTKLSAATSSDFIQKQITHMCNSVIPEQIFFYALRNQPPNPILSCFFSKEEIRMMHMEIKYSSPNAITDDGARGLLRHRCDPLLKERYRSVIKTVGNNENAAKENAIAAKKQRDEADRSEAKRRDSVVHGMIPGTRSQYQDTLTRGNDVACTHRYENVKQLTDAAAQNPMFARQAQDAQRAYIASGCK